MPLLGFGLIRYNIRICGIEPYRAWWHLFSCDICTSWGVGVQNVCVCTPKRNKKGVKGVKLEKSLAVGLSPQGVKGVKSVKMCEYYMDCSVCKYIGECSNSEKVHFSGMYPECKDFKCTVKCHPERECISYEEREDLYNPGW